jgi:hypothetical protein
MFKKQKKTSLGKWVGMAILKQQKGEAGRKNVQKYSKRAK